MNKEHIVNILKGENMQKQISHIRTLFSYNMNEFYFFKIFTDAFKSEGLIMKVNKIPNVIVDKVLSDCFINIYDGESIYVSKYDEDKLNKDIHEYNKIKGDMSILSSTEYLINIFINLLS